MSIETSELITVGGAGVGGLVLSKVFDRFFSKTATAAEGFEALKGELKALREEFLEVRHSLNKVIDIDKELAVVKDRQARGLVEFEGVKTRLHRTQTQVQMLLAKAHLADKEADGD